MFLKFDLGLYFTSSSYDLGNSNYIRMDTDESAIISRLFTIEIKDAYRLKYNILCFAFPPKIT